MKFSVFLYLVPLLLLRPFEAQAAIQLTLKPKATCPQVKLRKEFRQMTREEWNRFADALKTLTQRKKASDGRERSLYDEFASLDAQYSDEAKGYAPFLAYNRLQLKVFEEALQAVHPEVNLPYWDWTLDAAKPEASPLLTADYLGGNGEGSKSCVKSGPFADYQVPSAAGQECLKRSYYPGPTIAPFANRDHIEKVVLKTRRYDQLRQFLVYAPTSAVFHGIG